VSTHTATIASAAEQVKLNSRHLRGTIIEELALETDSFSKQTVQILKFHGTYQQDDRDARKTGQPAPVGSMVRVGVAGGILTPKQYLALDRLADDAGDGTLRVTSRQGIQFHRVPKTRLKPLIRLLNENLLTTLAACGDVVRNVVCCPAPLGGAWRDATRSQALELSRSLKPATRAYYEIWINGEKAAAAQPAQDENEPLYGSAYLPRKFKIGFAAPGDNCIDVYTNDIGIVPLRGAEGLEGFTVLAGGGLGVSPGIKATHPRLADPFCTVAPGELFDLVRAIIGVHRDLGNRANRKLARLKYVIDELGRDRFKVEVEARVGRKLRDPAPLEWAEGHDHLGWHEQGDGRWFLGVRVHDGRIQDWQGLQLRSALREVVSNGVTAIHLTPQQNVLLTGIRAEDRDGIENTLKSAGVKFAESLPPVFRYSMACPALPMCGQAITEAERVSPEVLADIDARLREAGLAEEEITVRLTGCPNGCARPLTAEIGVVGLSVNLYTIYLGGSRLGTRLAESYATNVPRTEIGKRLVPVFGLFHGQRSAGESFGDFCHRVGIATLRAATPVEAA
jgi:sulfite reductase (ferredoxin)